MEKSTFLDPALPEHNISRINEISLESKSFNKFFEDGTPYFTRLEFNIIDLCNRVCSFCPRSDPEIYPNNNIAISLDLYEKIMIELKSIEWSGGIVFSAFGEPLLHKNIIDLIKLTKKYCPDTILDIVTNGDKLNISQCKLLFEAGLDVLKISLFDGPEQIKIFDDIRTSLKIDPARFILRHRFNIDESSSAIIFSNRAGTVNIPGSKKIITPIKENCYFLFYKMVIDADGRVLICSHDWHKKVSGGNLNKENLVDIWKSPIFANIRKKLSNQNREFHPCNECDAKGTLNGKEAYLRWNFD